MRRMLTVHGDPDRFGFLDQLRKPFGEVGLAAVEGELAGPAGHLHELVDVSTQLVGGAEGDDGRRLLLDRFESIEGLRILTAEIGKIVRHAGYRNRADFRPDLS